MGEKWKGFIIILIRIVMIKKLRLPGNTELAKRTGLTVEFVYLVVIVLSYVHLGSQSSEIKMKIVKRKLQNVVQTYRESD